MQWNKLSEEACPVARALSVIGDRWTLLILRDCFLGLRRFDQFQTNLGITRHVLADRLKKLESAGVLERRLYQERPNRYEYRLTEAGKDFVPTLMSLIGWANRNIPTEGKLPFEILSRETGNPAVAQVVDEQTGAPITWRSLTLTKLD